MNNCGYKEWTANVIVGGVPIWIWYTIHLSHDYVSLYEKSWPKKDIEDLIIENQRRRGFSEELIQKSAEARELLFNIINKAFDSGIKEVRVPYNTVAGVFPKEVS